MPIRNTIQRRIVLDTVKALANHPTPENVYEEIRRNGGTLSRSTVYRNLEVLQKNGQLKKLDFSSRNTRYDGNTSRHNHIVCSVCGRVGDVPNISEEETANKVPKEINGWNVCEHYSVFFGRCPDCNKKYINEK